MISAKSLIDLIASFQFACENSRFSSLFAAEDVSRGITSATQRQKFHSGDVKSVRNPVRSADWSTEYLHCFSFVYEWLTKDKRSRRSNVNAMKLQQNSQNWWNIFFFRRSIWGLLELFRRWKQHFSKIDQENVKLNKFGCGTHDYQIYYVNIDVRHHYGISFAESQTFLRAKRPQRRRARRNGCFRRLAFNNNKKR